MRLTTSIPSEGQSSEYVTRLATNAGLSKMSCAATRSAAHR